MKRSIANYEECLSKTAADLVGKSKEEIKRELVSFFTLGETHESLNQFDREQELRKETQESWDRIWKHLYKTTVIGLLFVILLKLCI